MEVQVVGAVDRNSDVLLAAKNPKAKSRVCLPPTFRLFLLFFLCAVDWLLCVVNFTSRINPYLIWFGSSDSFQTDNN